MYFVHERNANTHMNDKQTEGQSDKQRQTDREEEEEEYIYDISEVKETSGTEKTRAHFNARLTSTTNILLHLHNLTQQGEIIYSLYTQVLHSFSLFHGLAREST